MISFPHFARKLTLAPALTERQLSKLNGKIAAKALRYDLFSSQTPLTFFYLYEKNYLLS